MARDKLRVQGSFVIQRLDYKKSTTDYTIVVKDESGVSGQGVGSSFSEALQLALDNALVNADSLGFKKEPW